MDAESRYELWDGAGKAVGTCFRSSGTSPGDSFNPQSFWTSLGDLDKSLKLWDEPLNRRDEPLNRRDEPLNRRDEPEAHRELLGKLK
jgi:hypothetical protein